MNSTLTQQQITAIKHILRPNLLKNAPRPILGQGITYDGGRSWYFCDGYRMAVTQTLPPEKAGIKLFDATTDLETVVDLRRIFLPELELANSDYIDYQNINLPDIEDIKARPAINDFQDMIFIDDTKRMLFTREYLIDLIKLCGRKNVKFRQFAENTDPYCWYLLAQNPDKNITYLLLSCKVDKNKEVA